MVYLSYTCLLLLAAATHARNVFTSYQHMEELFLRESRLLDSLQAAMHHHKNQLEFLTQRHAEISSLRPDGDSGLRDYLGHPVHGFTLVRRLVKEWPFILNIMSQHYEPPRDLVDQNKGVITTDMQSALRGITRLQIVYNLDTDRLADGWVEDHQSLSKLTAADCWDVAQFLLDRHELLLALSWLQTAARRVHREQDSSVSVELITSSLYIVNTLAKCQSNVDPRPSEHLLTTLLTKNPGFSPDTDTAELFRLAFTSDCSWYKGTKKESLDMTAEQHARYNEACRAGANAGSATLKCHLIHYHNPALLLAPFKLEELHIDPPLVRVHQVISNREIRELKQFFLEGMSDCEVVQDSTLVASSYRACSRSFVPDSATPAAARLTRRIGYLADLDMRTSEVHQMTCYGLGGEYKLHHDWVPLFDTHEYIQVGPRIATVVVYLNDVDRGGHTVFPRLNVSVAPTQGSAILWFNIRYDGSQDNRVEHGSCPVLIGHKWVINKLIHFVGQDIRHCPSDKIYPKDYFYL